MFRMASSNSTDCSLSLAAPIWERYETRSPRVHSGAAEAEPRVSAPVRITVMGCVRTEASVGLALAWNPCGPIDERDVSVLRRFLAAVRELACRGQLRVAGDISLLDRAIRVGDVSVADLPVESGLTRLETQEKHLIITVLGTITVIGVCIAVDVGWASGRSTTAVGTTGSTPTTSRNRYQSP